MSSSASYPTDNNSLNPSWYWLRLFNYYRGALALFFITVYLNGWAELLINPDYYRPLVFYTASIAYIMAFVIFMPSIHQQRPRLETQVILQTCVDVSIIIALMYASGGVRSGLGMLLIINISMTSLFLQKRVTLLFAAATSIAILVGQIYLQIVIDELDSAFTQAGILGILIFIFAFMTSNVARQLRETEQRADEQSRELESAVHMNEHIIRNMRTGILVASPDGSLLMANNAAESLLGNIKLLPNASLKKISSDLFERLTEWQESIEPPQQIPIQQSHGLPDIQPGFSPIDPDKGKKGRTLIFLEDASQLSQRFQQVKLASLGRLTASIAHEIRNPLGAIHHAAQLLDEAITEPADVKLTQIINTQVQRLNGVVENVLQLSRQQRGTPEGINLLGWLVQFRDEFTTSHKLKSQQINLDIQPESTTILFDHGHLHQVFWNLCSNAINHSGIETDHLTISLQGGITQDSTQPFIDIIDNGQGISEDIEQQIFEPFFTTGTNSTGLGLYITKEVVESNRAKIRHIALPSGGTCFRIYFMQASTQKSGTQ
jgi:two-component system sensor histidine kinase PilS (NtrC family)